MISGRSVSVKNTAAVSILCILILAGVKGPSWCQAGDSLLRVGALVNFYNEPALRPGVTMGVDWEYSLDRNWKAALILPEVTYFYFPDNFEAWYLYPEISVRRVADNGFYMALGGGAGYSFSRKIVPVYNIEGEQIRDTHTRQYFMTVQLYTGYDFSRRFSRLPLRMYASLGWKGLYPNNLRIQNAAIMQIGASYSIFSLPRKADSTEDGK